VTPRSGDPHASADTLPQDSPGIEQLLALLARQPGDDSTFNQYRDRHPELDQPRAVEVRRANLMHYLDAFSVRAGVRFVLVGEAAGYAGCRFSGIPFTCEAQITGLVDHPIFDWTLGKGLERSSAGTFPPWVERSARMVWETLAARRDCVLWNAFPWHPCRPAEPLSNRPPGRELEDGLQTLECFLALYAGAQPVAIGRVAQRALAAIGIDAPYIRHPSRGGKRKFVAGMAELGS
jgi:hypothetical protein